MSKYSCSIIIRAYNEEAHIGRLLTGITQQSAEGLEIILVDSGSTDDTVKIAERFPVKIIPIKPETFTFGSALNRGIQASSADIIVIASAHVYPIYPDWLEQLLTPFADPKVALVYGKQRGNGDSKFSEHQIFARWFPEQSQSHQLHPFCNNANAAVRRSLWEQHPYDETLTGLEDLAWARWAMDEEYKIAYSAEAEIAHIHDERPRGVYNRYRREAIAFKRIFPDEEFSLWDFMRLSVFNIFSDLWHALRQKKLIGSFGSIFWFRLMQFWGTFQGYQYAGPITAKLRQTFYYPRSLRAASTHGRDVKPIDYREQK